MDFFKHFVSLLEQRGKNLANNVQHPMNLVPFHHQQQPQQATPQQQFAARFIMGKTSPASLPAPQRPQNSFPWMPGQEGWWAPTPGSATPIPMPTTYGPDFTASGPFDAPQWLPDHAKPSGNYGYLMPAQGRQLMPKQRPRLI